jgi:pimeloyl-ACP methyl ester carboxylesterase
MTGHSALKTFISNRKGQKVAVLVEIADSQKGIAFVMHGLSGNKEQLHIQTFAEVWKEHGYTVVRFDTTNTFGESDGDFADATVTNYYQDLEDVIAWASKQEWYEEPFCLEGHSLGGICTALFAEKFPDKVKALAPISTVISGKLSWEKEDPEELKDWQQTGWRTESSTRPGVIKRLKWSHMEDRLKYDVIPDANKLTMPVFLLTGELDTSTPPRHQKILFDALSGKKELHIIPGAPHTLKEAAHLSQIKELLSKWVSSL